MQFLFDIGKTPQKIHKGEITIFFGGGGGGYNLKKEGTLLSFKNFHFDIYSSFRPKYYKNALCHTSISSCIGRNPL